MLYNAMGVGCSVQAFSGVRSNVISVMRGLGKGQIYRQKASVE